MPGDRTTAIGLPTGDATADDGGLAGWRVDRVTGAFPTAVSFWLERDDSEAKIQILVRQRGEAPCLQSTELGDVSYRQFSGMGEREAADVTRAFAEDLDAGRVPVARYFPHLASDADIDDDGSRLRLAQIIEPAIPLLGDHREGFNEIATATRPSRLIFDPPGIAEFLEPELSVDGAALLGWVFRGIYLPSVARRESSDFSAYVLEFTREDREQAARLTLRVDGSDTKAFGRCGRLSLGIAHDGEIDAIPAETASLASWVSTLLRLRSSSELEIQLPASIEELRAISHPPRADAIEARVEHDEAGDATAAAEQGPAPALNLALDPECGQKCVFCSVKSYVTPTDAGETDLDDVRIQLRQARQRGVGEVRLNGIDPLRHSRVLDAIEAVQAMGFPALTVFSTGRRLADPDFRKQLLERAPAHLRVFVPLYGLSAETHDLVTGTPGAHAEVWAAISGLNAEAPEGTVHISTVFVKQNVDEVVAMLLHLKKSGIRRVDAHLPYPMRPTTRDPYVDSAVRESELLTRLLADVERLPSDERRWALPIVVNAFRHPCIPWQRERGSVLPALGASFPQRAFPLAGTEYRSDQFVHASGTSGEGGAFAVAVVECPHVARCALAAVCPGEHYSVYAEHFGLDEFAPVHPQELYDATPSRSDDTGLWSRVKRIFG